jgi:hypothetical protein
MKYLAALLCMFLAFGTASAARKDPYSVQQVVDDMSYPGVHVDVVWEDCWAVNAFYQPRTHKLTMCNELRRVMTPGQVRYAAAHEMGHAIIHQLDIPITGLEETAADELAAYVLTTTHRVADVHEAAQFWLSLGRPEDPQDEHPGDIRRYYTLECLAEGAENGLKETDCVKQWRHTVKVWNRLLSIDTE